MNHEKRLQDLENRLLKLDADRVSLIREIQNLREEIARDVEASRPLLGRAIQYSDMSMLRSNVHGQETAIMHGSFLTNLFQRNWVAHSEHLFSQSAPSAIFVIRTNGII